MINFTNGIQGIQQLQAALRHNNISLKLGADYIVIKSSKTESEIRELFDAIKFCPLFSDSKVGGNFIVSMVPYRCPESFSNDSYFTLKEISELFKSSLFISGKPCKDRWSSVNEFRGHISPALSQGISEIVQRSAKDNLAIIEIGSGIGYSLSGKISSTTIKTQQDAGECQLLKKSINEPIYKLDIESVCKRLEKMQKKVPLFFALNVFDCLSSTLRKKSFLQLSKLQCTGDRILSMHDTNPLLEQIFKDLRILHPDHAILPYYSGGEETNLSAIMVPKDKFPFIPTEKDFVSFMEDEVKSVMNKSTSPLQQKLRLMQKELDLKVIDLELFSAGLIAKEFNEIGYETEVSYHASFTVGQAGITQDLAYKRVTDLFTVREWCTTDEKFLKGLSKKHLKLPEYVNETFLRKMRMSGQKLLGAEILVIEATKK